MKMVKFSMIDSAKESVQDIIPVWINPKAVTSITPFEKEIGDGIDPVRCAKITVQGPYEIIVIDKDGTATDRLSDYSESRILNPT